MLTLADVSKICKMNQEFFFKKDFWSGYYKLTERRRTSPAEGIVAYLFIFGLILLLLGLAIMSLPLWLVILGIGINKEYRYWAGIASILTLTYFYIDVHFKWLTPYFFFGYINDEGELSGPLLGFGAMRFFNFVNLFSATIGLYYIVDYLFFRFSNYYTKGLSYLFLLLAILIGVLSPMVVNEKFFAVREEYMLVKDSKLVEALLEEVEPIPELPTVELNNQTIIESEIPEQNQLSTSTAYYAENSDYTSSIINYFEAVSRDELNASDYFAAKVTRYITLSNTTSKKINESFKADSDEYREQKFKFDKAEIEYLGQTDGIRNYQFWLDFYCYRATPDKNQHSKMLVNYSLDGDGKITSLTYPQVEFTKYY